MDNFVDLLYIFETRNFIDIASILS